MSITAVRHVGAKTAGIFLLALVLRLLYWHTPAIQFHPTASSDVVCAGVLQAGDSPRYVALASNLIAGVGYRYERGGPFTMFDAPGYPLFLTAILAIRPAGFGMVLFLQCLLDAAVCVFLVLISKVVLRRSLPGLLGGLAYAVYYPNFMYATWILTETLFTFLLVLFFLLLFLALDSRRLRAFALCGLAFGYLCLTKPGPMYFLPLLVVVPFAGCPDRRRALRQSAVLFACAAVLLVPWLAQGPLRFGRLIMGTMSAPETVLAGVSVDYDGDYETQAWEHTNSPFGQVFHSGLPQDQMEQRYRELSRQELRRNLTQRPGQALMLMVRQVSRFYLNIPFRRPQSAKSYAVAALNAVILVLGLAGWWRERRRAALWVLGLFILYYTGIHSLVCALIRYSAPLMPLWLWLAALAVESFVPQRVWSRGDPAAAATGWSRLQPSSTAAARRAGGTDAG